jgi:hypothetical protein
MLRKTLKLATIGFLMGMITGNIIAYFTAGDTYALVSEALVARIGSETAAIIVQTVMSGIYGAIAMGGVSFYEIEEWSLLRTAFTHYALCMISFIPIALLLGWIRPEAFLLDYSYSAAGQTVTYVIIFMIMYIRYRHEVKELNSMLEEIEAKREKNDKKE